MSVISQFFPSGSGGGGGSSNEIPVEIVGMAGGGGGGGNAFCPTCPAQYYGYGGSGGMGGFFHATDYTIIPGTTVPITIGSGGPGASSNPTCGAQGSNGGTTCFNYPQKPIVVRGGGGGGGGLTPYINSCPSQSGLDGGSGGGGGGGCGSLGSAGQGFYMRKEYIANSIQHSYLLLQPGPTCVGNCGVSHVTIDGESLPTPWGYMGGFPGVSGWISCGPGQPYGYKCGGCGGGISQNYVRVCYCTFAAPNTACLKVSHIGNLCMSNYITGTNVAYGSSIGKGGDAGNAGCNGIVIIKWATVHGAAPPTGFPGGTDISPQTPGYYTYCFTTSGSITLP